MSTTRVYRGSPNLYTEIGSKGDLHIGLNLSPSMVSNMRLVVRLMAVSDNGTLPDFVHFTPRKSQKYTLLDDQKNAVVSLNGVGLNRIQLPLADKSMSRYEMEQLIVDADVPTLVASFLTEQMQLEGVTPVENLADVIRGLLLPNNLSAKPEPPKLALEFPSNEEFKAIGKKQGEYYFSKAGAHSDSSDGWNDPDPDEETDVEDDDFDVDE